MTDWVLGCLCAIIFVTALANLIMDIQDIQARKHKSEATDECLP